MSLKFINVLIDERPVQAQLGYTIMQTCSNAGVDVPRFCYHDKLLIAGNCRICLVEVTGSKKLVASCAVHVSDSMAVYTNTARVRIARQNVLEFLLANHPLDCPICDQGGECDLQDITTLFGADRGRFYENEKRAVLNKDFGPLIRTSMNRCIHCTRCVRFLTMSSGISLLGTLGRGSSTEIGTYINQFMSDELSGNITDLCPVGALTSKPYSFKARPWELTSVRSLDVFDSLNSPILFDIMANKICRVLPYANDSLNECWLTNRARYAYDGLFVQRLDSCLLKVSTEFFATSVNEPALLVKTNTQSFIKVSWAAAFCVFFMTLLSPSVNRLIFLIGNHFDLESTLALATFTNLIGGGSIFYETSRFFDSRVSDWDFLYLFNTSLIKVSKLPSFCLLVGINLRFEAPLLNLRINRLSTERNVAIFKIGGSARYSSYKTKLLSNTLTSLYSIFEFKHAFCKNFYISSFGYKPFILVSGSFLFARAAISLSYGLIEFVRRITRVCVSYAKTKLNLFSEFCYFGFLHQYSAAIHLLSIGGVSRAFSDSRYELPASTAQLSLQPQKTTLLYSLGFDRMTSALRSSTDVFLIYQGSHGVSSASAANLVLPSTTYVEKAGILKNLTGSVQKMEIAVQYKFGAKSDLDIFRGLASLAESSFFKNFLSFSFKNSLIFNTSFFLNSEFLLDSQLFGFNAKQSNFDASLQNLAFFHYVLTYNLKTDATLLNCIALSPRIKGKIFSNYLFSCVVNYYGDASSNLLLTSKTMTLCSNLSLKKNFSFTSTYY